MNDFAIVSHDAGGAELLSHYVKSEGLDACYVLEGPAIDIFNRVLGAITIISLEDALKSSKQILTGTSGQSELEWQALCRGGAQKIKTITFLDHWCNYSERFVRNDIKCIPDCLWVADKYAEQMASNIFLDTPIKCVGNPYLDSIKELAAVHDLNKPKDSPLQILIVTDPIAEHALLQYGDARYHGYTEFDAVECALKNIPYLLQGNELGGIIVRPHPSELESKYEYLSEKYPDLDIVIRKKQSLLDDLIESDLVIGCQTMALVAAIAAGKRVISCIPDGGDECILPHSEIEHLRKMED